MLVALFTGLEALGLVSVWISVCSLLAAAPGTLCLEGRRTWRKKQRQTHLLTLQQHRPEITKGFTVIQSPWTCLPSCNCLELWHMDTWLQRKVGA